MPLLPCSRRKDAGHNSLHIFTVALSLRRSPFPGACEPLPPLVLVNLVVLTCPDQLYLRGGEIALPFMSSRRMDMST